MDLSLLGDGSGPLPFDCSTPKTQRLKFTCHVCKKEYVSKFYFEKHVRTHPDQVPISHNVSNAVHLDESELSFSQLRDINDNTVSFRVPTARPPAKRKLNVAKNQAKNSSDKAKKVKPQLICTYCLKGYVCRRSFKTHMMTHTLQEAAARFPDIEDIIANSDEIAKESLTDVANSASFGECGAKFKQVVGHVVSVLGDEEWKEFSAQVCADLVKVIADKKCLLPSSLVNTLIAQLEEMLTNIELCDGYLKGLQLLDLFERDVLSQIVHATTRFLKRSANKKPCHILDPGSENGKWLELKRQKLLSAANVIVRFGSPEANTSSDWLDVIPQQ
ncbi:uncharacterized protein LOC113213086 [Frankliniella occidentalis]|uniref:Uncharacterized protein LOC113213086 n=1 Tax=Frankliniella occidentalis TaxID=133901 RepID=A0A9C6X5Q4_FRAOC|nr:uncharacterized protein LOC113213086 [Frankliniella occidentalis]